MARSALRFDMRAPDFSPASSADQITAALDMCAYADERGFATVTLSEHHGVEDGFLPSPLVMAGQSETPSIVDGTAMPSASSTVGAMSMTDTAVSTRPGRTPLPHTISGTRRSSSYMACP